jgi:multiple antibiotic resistance protein
MVFERRHGRKQESVKAAVGTDPLDHIAAFPLAIPLMAGPGAITAVILISSQLDCTVLGVAILIAFVCAMMGLCLLVFALAENIDRLLGVTGSIVLSRLLGVLLAALSVQFIVDGVRLLVTAG